MKKTKLYELHIQNGNSWQVARIDNFNNCMAIGEMSRQNYKIIPLENKNKKIKKV